MNKNLGYAAIFFHRRDDYGVQILLQKKDRGWRGIDLWTPFGGRIEGEESPLDCLQREVGEELGLDITNKQLELFKEIQTTTKAGEEVPLYIYTAQFDFPLQSVRLQEGCGFAFWYSDELTTVPMQEHEKLVAQEITNSLSA